MTHGRGNQSVWIHPSIPMPLSKQHQPLLSVHSLPKITLYVFMRKTKPTGNVRAASLSCVANA